MTFSGSLAGTTLGNGQGSDFFEPTNTLYIAESSAITTFTPIRPFQGYVDYGTATITSVGGTKTALNLATGVVSNGGSFGIDKYVVLSEDIVFNFLPCYL